MADKKISQLTAATTPLAGTEVLPIVQSGSTVKVSAADITAGRNISASGLTLSGGTANGLLYLNASKAASAGSLLTFNETTVNLAGSTRTFRATADSGTAYTQLASDGVYATGTDLYLFAPASKFVSFYSGGSEKLRLESSGNLIVSTAGKGIDFSANTGAAGETSALLNWYEEGTWTPQLASGATNATMGANNAGRYTRIGRVVHIHAYVETSSVAGIGGGTLSIKGLPFTVNSGYSGYGGSPAGFASGLNITAGQVVSFRPGAATTELGVYLWNSTAGTTDMTGTEWSDDGIVAVSLTYLI